MLEPDEIREFQQIIEEEHGVKLTENEAIVMAQRLLSLYELIHQPLSGEATTPLSDSFPDPNPHPAS